MVPSDHMRYGRAPDSVLTGGEGSAGLARLEGQGLYEPPSASPPPWPNVPGGPRYTEPQFEALREEMTGET